MSIHNTQRVLSFPLVFPNKFFSNGAKLPRLPPIVAPISNEGLTSVERQENALRLARYEQMQNAGIKMRKWDGTVYDPSEIYGDSGTSFSTSLLPQGYKSADARSKLLTAQRKIQMQNAGILSEKDKALQQLATWDQQRKMYEQRKKLVEYFALRDDEDSVPAEFQEEVLAYYNLHPEVRDQVRRAREQYKELQKKKREQYGKPEGKVNVLDQGSNQQAQGHGWKAPRLHSLLSPMKRIEPLLTAEELVEQQKNELDERQKLYKDQQTEERGIAPPSDMVKRAMPETAEPTMLPIPNIKNVMLVPHRFIFPKRRYMLSKVRK